MVWQLMMPNESYKLATGSVWRSTAERNRENAQMRERSLTNLFGQHEVSVASHGGAVCDEVGDRLHDVPGVLPPRQPRQHPKLHAHQAQAHPRQYWCLAARLHF